MPESSEPSSVVQRVVSRILEASFPGREELQVQLAHARFNRLKADGALSWSFEVPDNLPLAPVQSNVPVEAETSDVDGKPMHLLLHVIHGKLCELEIYREDAKVVQAIPEPERLRVIVLS